MSTCDGGELYEQAPTIGPLSDDSFPANGLWSVGDIGSWYRNGSLVVVDSEPAAAARLDLDVYRPRVALQPGDVLTYWNEKDCARPCSYCESWCDGVTATITAPDLTSPARPDLVVHTQLVANGTAESGSYCADYDRMLIEIAVSDDATPTEALAIQAYVAPTLDELAALTVPSMYLTFDYGSTTEISFGLGQAAGHMRDGSLPFLSPDPFCFSLATVDHAGNVSERSTPVCLHTTDESDPTVEFIPPNGSSVGCLCAGGTGGGMGAALLVALVTMRLVRAGR